jgi:hypothetical protein
MQAGLTGRASISGDGSAETGRIVITIRLSTSSNCRATARPAA